MSTSIIQVDAIAKQVIQTKGPCRIGTVANIADLAAGAPNVIDGVTLAAGNRILVKAQDTGAQNGIYQVDTLGTGADGVWSRTADASVDPSIVSGLAISLSEGSKADSIWILTTNDPITIGVSNLQFKQMTGPAAISSNELANGAVTAGKIAVGGISASNQLAASVVDSAAIADNAVTSTELASAAVTAGKIAVGGVSASNQLTASIVDSAAIADNAVTSSELAANAVTAGKIATGGISANTQFAAGVVDNGALANLSVSTGKIQAQAVTSNEIAEGTIMPGDMNLAQNYTFTGILAAKGGFGVNRATSAGSPTVQAGDTIIGITDTSAPRTVNLQAAGAAGAGKIVIIKDESGAAGTNNITVDGNAAETIDGAATKLINTNYGSMTLYCSGIDWFIV